MGIHFLNWIIHLNILVIQMSRFDDFFIFLNPATVVLHRYMILLVCVDALLTSQQFFSHVEASHTFLGKLG